MPFHDRSCVPDPRRFLFASVLALLWLWPALPAATVQVLSPDSGEMLTIGQSPTLSWSASDNVAVTAVDMSLSRSGTAGPYEALVTGIANGGSFVWTATGPPTTDARLKVVAHDAATNAGEDLSNAGSTIAAPTGVGEWHSLPEIPRMVTFDVLRKGAQAC